MPFLTGEVLDNVLNAMREGIDATTEAAAEDARGTSMTLPLHEAAGYFWFGTTDRVEDAVVTEPARIEGLIVSGKFGATKRRGDYAFFLERLHPYIRPAADRNFTNLPDNAREHLDA